MKYQCKAKNNNDKEITFEFEVKHSTFARGTAIDIIAHYNKENKLEGTKNEFYFIGCETKRL